MAFEQMFIPVTSLDATASLKAPVDFDRSFSIGYGIRPRLWEEEFIESEGLPPREFWNVDLYNSHNMIETPVNELGLVDAAKLIKQAKDFIDPAYQWGGKFSIHHLYHEGWWYGLPSAGQDAMRFRELPVNKIKIWRILENVIHKMVLQPDIPGQDFMEMSVEAWDICHRIFPPARRIVNIDKQRQVRLLETTNKPSILKGYKGLDSGGEYHFNRKHGKYLRGIETHMAELYKVPTEFRFVEPRDDLAEDPSRRSQFARELGRVVARKAIPVQDIID